MPWTWCLHVGEDCWKSEVPISYLPSLRESLFLRSEFSPRVKNIRNSFALWPYRHGMNIIHPPLWDGWVGRRQCSSKACEPWEALNTDPGHCCLGVSFPLPLLTPFAESGGHCGAPYTVTNMDIKELGKTRPLLSWMRCVHCFNPRGTKVKLEWRISLLKVYIAQLNLSPGHY